MPERRDDRVSLIYWLCGKEIPQRVTLQKITIIYQQAAHAFRRCFGAGVFNQL
jgi:hypothetical protein